MSKFNYHIHYRSWLKIGKPDGLSGCSGEDTSGMDSYFIDEVQLLDRENNDDGKQEDAEDAELEGIDVAI